MKHAVNHYSSFRTQLLEEKVSLTQRITRIEETLNALEGLSGSPAGRKPGRPATRATASPGGPRRRRRSFKRMRNALSLRAAMLKAMSARPLTKPEILTGVQKEGYKFSASKPMNSINVLLYTKGLFKKLPGKRFSPAK